MPSVDESARVCSKTEQLRRQLSRQVISFDTDIHPASPISVGWGLVPTRPHRWRIRGLERKGRMKNDVWKAKNPAEITLRGFAYN